MPELPEVETIKNQLKEKIIGKTIKGVEVKLPKMIKGMEAKEFIAKVKGAKIKDISRRAKLLIISLSNGYSLLIHLKLTGQIIYCQKFPEGKNQKYSHLIYYFSDGSVLSHNDLRQLGYVKLVKTANLPEFFLKEKFGPEPLEKDFTLEKFKEILGKKVIQKMKLERNPPKSRSAGRRRIKPLLMDQSFIAGVGNVYANEVCFCAGVLPTREAGDFKDKEIKKLYQCLINILQEAIRLRGTSADTYVDLHGRKGKYLPKLKVYGREGKKCLNCQSKIKRIVLAGRGTFYCPRCQLR